MKLHADVLTITSLLRVHDIDAAALYDIASKAINYENERLKIHRANNNPKQYVASMNRICQYQRLQSLIRIDTLDGLRIGLREQSIN